jgi:endonuclease-3
VANWCPSFGSGETNPAKAAKLLKYELAPGSEELLAKLLAETHRAAEIRMESQRRTS